MSLGTAFKAFFAALSSRETSDALRRVLDDHAAGTPILPPPEKEEPAPTTPVQPVRTRQPQRSDSLTLLAMLQRESRLVDLIQEPLEQFTDAQVGAAARPCLKQCQQTLQRVFELQPLVAAEEGSPVTVPAGASPARFQWIGERSGTGEATGRLVHPGWVAAKCELAQWTGTSDDANIVAAAQVQA